MKSPTQYKAILLVVILLTGFTASSQVYRKNKAIIKAFKVEKTTELTIKNKYGNIQFIGWNKDSVKFEVAIEVKNKKEAKATATLEDLYVDFVASKHFLEARTSSISSESFWSGIKDKTSSVFSSENKIEINYKVYLPSDMSIQVENKYGDILIDDQVGAVSITLSNGDLRAHALMGGANVNLQFAFASIKKMNDGKLNLGYQSEVRLGSANDLQIESKSSRVKIEKVNKLNVKSHRDKYHLNEVGGFIADNSYTYLEIRNLKNNLSVNAKYGNIDVLSIESTVAKLNFRVENTDISFTKPAGRSIGFNLVYDEKAGLYFPEELQNKITTKKDEEKKLVETSGVLGTKNSNTLDVKATLISGNIRVD